MLKRYLVKCIPLLIGTAISAMMHLWIWWGFWFVFAWIGGWITIGLYISDGKTGISKNIGRRVSILMGSMTLFIFLGFMQRENLQLEENVIYIAYFMAGGVFTRVLFHYTVAKVLGPFIWGRGFCGWACWTAALLEWLPIKENRKIPRKYTYFRIPVLIISLLIPFVLIQTGYDYMNGHIEATGGDLIKSGKLDQFIWFLIGNGLYYSSAVILAFAFGKKRAFCKIACPVSLVMKAQTKLSLIKVKPSGNKCIECAQCNRHCPMDVEVMSYIRAGKPISSSECILCGLCQQVCPSKAIG